MAIESQYIKKLHPGSNYYDIYERATGKKIEKWEDMPKGVNVDWIKEGEPIAPIQSAPQQPVTPQQPVETAPGGFIQQSAPTSYPPTPSLWGYPVVFVKKGNDISMTAAGSLGEYLREGYQQISEEEYGRKYPKELARITGKQIQQPTQTAKNIPLSQSGKYYKTGNDVFESGTNRPIALDEFKRLGLNFKFIPEGKYTAKGIDITKTPEGVSFKKTDEYKNLPQEMRDFIDIAYNTIEVGGEEEARMFSNAITQAQAIADPYFKTQLAMAKAEVFGAIAERTQDFEARREAIQRARDELMEDVSRNKDFLTLDQQAEISRTVKSYDEDLLAIADQAAEKGLTMATGERSRALAEERRTSQFQDVIQSSRRRLNFQLKELELKASRGDIAAQKQLSDLQAKQTFGLQQIGRAAEEVLGTANLPAISGFMPTGDAMGKIEEEKRRAVISDVGGFMELQKGII